MTNETETDTAFLDELYAYAEAVDDDPLILLEDTQANTGITMIYNLAVRDIITKHYGHVSDDLLNDLMDLVNEHDCDDDCDMDHD
jgi:hypothetical protein